MAGTMILMKAMWCIVVVAAVVSAPRRALARIGCGIVVSDLTPCAPYVMGPNPLSNSCCSGVKALYKAASTTPDRQSVCKCLKQLASAYNVDHGKAAGLPSQCGVNIPYKIDPSTDCATVQ